MQDPKNIPEVLKKRMEAWRDKPRRDPKRIAGLLKVLEETWREEPDLRLGQIIVSAAILSGKKVVCPEIFHLEDEDMLRGIAELAKRK
jgi:hypothetical protein